MISGGHFGDDLGFLLAHVYYFLQKVGQVGPTSGMPLGHFRVPFVCVWDGFRGRAGGVSVRRCLTICWPLGVSKELGLPRERTEQNTTHI